METESDGTIPVLDVPFIRKRPSVTTRVYRKPAHTGRYLHFESCHLSGCPKWFIDSVLKSRNSRHPEREEKADGLVFIPYMKGISEKVKHIGNRYNIRTVFKTKHTLRSSL
jgi:hypothetical protein